MSDPTATAAALEAGGRLPDAIAAWTEINRSHPTAEIETRLVSLRHRAADALEISSPSPAWTRTYDDPFPDVHGRPPEILPAALTAEALGGAIRHHGCLLVRGLVDAARASRFADVIRRAVDAREACRTGTSNGGTSPWYEPDVEFGLRSRDAFGIRVLNYGVGSLLAADSPRGLLNAAEVLESTRVLAVVSEYLGERPLVTVEKTVLRQVFPPDKPHSWHQDGSFLDRGVRTVDAWVALSDCGPGTDAAGLEIIPGRVDRLAQFGGPGTRVPIQVLDEDATRAAKGAHAMCPTFAAGDALLFDELFLHRTGALAGATRPRYTLECWMFAPSSSEPSYVPLYV